MQTTNVPVRTAVAAVALLLTATCAPAERVPAVPAGYIEIVDRLSAFIEHEMESKDLDAISIALVDDQETVWSAGFGYARPADSLAATAGTVYRVGSVSKLFTDIAIMQLVEAGELDLDAPVTTWLPGFAPAGRGAASITLRHLMSHRAGLVREPPVGHYFDTSGPTLEATVASLNDTRLIYAPGERTKYSNAGIAVVGRVFEHVAGRPFAEALDSAVLGPIGMTRSAFVPRADLVDSLATATMWSYDGQEFDAPGFQLGMAPAGSMYSTVGDLGIFLSMLFAAGEGRNGRVLSAGMLEAMWTPQFAPAGARTGYGIGFGIGELDGHRTIGHGGAIYGFATTLSALPDERLGVVVVTTADFANRVTDRIADYALRLMLASREGRVLPEAETTQSLPAGLAYSLEGRWAGGDMGFDLVERSGRLQLRPPEGVWLDLRARAETLVADSRLGYGMRLVRAGDALAVVDGDTLLRQPPGGPPPPPPAGWTGLIGEYGWDHDPLYILEQDGRLYALIEWFLFYPLERVAGDVWSFPDRGLYAGEQLAFTRGTDGTATQVSLEGLVFPRREVGTSAGETFRIRPVRPVEELRAEALAAEPPVETGTFREPDLVELRDLDPTIRYDIRYATTNNFMSAVFYREPHAFLQRPAAEAVVRAHEQLAGHGLGLLIHDAYRPWYVTRMFWDATPADMKQFVADPSSGSRHNRGAAVDLTMYDRTTGEVIRTVGGYDEFSPRSYPDYPGGTSRQRWYRELLRDVMEANGFTVYEFEWWHFDYDGWRDYPILDLTFEELAR